MKRRQVSKVGTAVSSGQHDEAPGGAGARRPRASRAPVGRWTGRGLAALGLAPGEEVTEAQLRNLFGESGRHPHADRIEADRLAQGDSPKEAFKADALGRRVTVTGVDFVFLPQPTIYLLWAFGDEETRRVIEAAHEHAIERVLEWIEDEVAVIRYGKDGIYRVRPPGGLVAARFRHHEARSGRPLLHDHLLLSVKRQRLDGKWGSVHTTALHENTVATEVCEALGLATEPRIVTPGRRPVMEIAVVPHELRGRLPPLHRPVGPGLPPLPPPTRSCVRPGPTSPSPGEWDIPRVPLQYKRAVLAGAVVREQLRTTTATAVLGRAYDVVAHHQAAMPEQLLAPEPTDPEHDGQEPEAGPGEAIDMKALRALRASRTDVEALDLTADWLRHLQ